MPKKTEGQTTNYTLNEHNTCTSTDNDSANITESSSTVSQVPVRLANLAPRPPVVPMCRVGQALTGADTLTFLFHPSLPLLYLAPTVEISRGQKDSVLRAKYTKMRQHSYGELYKK